MSAKFLKKFSSNVFMLRSTRLEGNLNTVDSNEMAHYEPSHMSRIMRKPAFCICENKDTDQLRGNRKADQCLCFRYIDTLIQSYKRTFSISFF